MAELDIEALKLIAMYLSNPAIDNDVRAATEKELVEQLPAIIAALEDRDRLRAAAQGVYVDEAGFCHGLGKLKAVLEDHDG